MMLGVVAASVAGVRRRRNEEEEEEEEAKKQKTKTDLEGFELSKICAQSL